MVKKYIKVSSHFLKLVVRFNPRISQEDNIFIDRIIIEIYFNSYLTIRIVERDRRHPRSHHN